jgi:hypothetical protein
MADSETQSFIDRLTRTLQIIIGALVAGVIVFLVIAVFVQLHPGRPAVANPGQNPPRSTAMPVLTLTACVFAATMMPLSIVVPKLMVDATRKRIAADKNKLSASSGASALDAQLRSDVHQLAGAYQSQKIVGAALNEAVAYLATMAYLIEGNYLALGLAIALLGAVAARFPRRAAVEQWIGDQFERLSAQRGLAT